MNSNQRKVMKSRWINMVSYLHKEFRYENSDGRYMFVTKQEAYDAYMKGKHIKIGCQDKYSGAFYAVEQFENELPTGVTMEEKLKHALKQVEDCLPHKRIKFRICCHN